MSRSNPEKNAGRNVGRSNGKSVGKRGEKNVGKGVGKSSGQSVAEAPPDRIRCEWAMPPGVLREYHDNEYGFPVSDDVAYFERLILELFQAGLSWRTILEKRPAFRKAFEGFDPRRVATMGQSDVERLMQDSGIIRNRLKIESTIENARRFLEIVSRHGSFRAFLATVPLHDRAATVKLFRKTFKFMGPLIVEEFLMSTGHWPIRHQPACFLFTEDGLQPR